MAIAGILSGIAGLVGVGISYAAAEDEANQQKQYYGVGKQIVGVQQQENYQRYLAMQYSSQRQNLENLRNVQKTIAASTNFAANAGGTFGSSLSEARGATKAQGAFNTSGISLGVQSGQTMYGLSNQQTNLQMQQADIMTNIATDKGQEALGNAIISASGAFGRMFTPS